jgi:uncharacterized membrane protein YgcG
VRINLAKVVPFLCLVGIFLLWAAAQNTGTDETPDDGYDYGYDTPDTGRADAYFDAVASELADPGVYVDPAVTEISPTDAERLDALAARTSGPVRVLVVPADALRESDPNDPDAGYSNDISYADDELPGQLYDRVGVDGTYAVLVDADTSYDGRSFTAYQFAEERPFYEVEDAVNTAVDCCAPDYTSMLDSFLEHADDEQTNPWPIVGWVVAAIAALLALVIGGRRFRRHRWRKLEDEQVADALRPSLQEEVVELSATVAALPPAPAGNDELSKRTRQVLDLVEEARHRLDAGADDDDDQDRMDTPDDVEGVVRRLADARYELAAIDALRNGRPQPEKTAPCFFDPRHGPSVTVSPFTPEGGAERSVPVCAHCRDELAAGRVPPSRTLKIGDLVRPYWQWDRYTRPYVNGYWQRHTFADSGVQRIRFAPSPALSRPEKPAWGGIEFVWESDGGSGGSGGSGSGGGRRFSGSSGSRSSFGGGSSSRSSQRSGGSRRF